MSERWTDERIGRLDGKRVLITGANTGLGLQTARVLARCGATVILAGRDSGKLETAAGEIRAFATGAGPETVSLDLADLSSVQEAAASLVGSGGPLDILINNAGVMAVPERRETKDGFELTFGTNHLGHFALTGRLLPTLLRAPAARVVTVSAVAANWRKGALVDLNSEESYSGMSAYAKSKRANVVFTEELQRRAPSVRLIALAVHPGSSDTGIQRNLPRLVQLATKFLLQPINQAAWPTLYGATAAELRGGEFIGPKGRAGRGSPAILPLPRDAGDPAVGRELWEASERLTGVKYEFNTNQNRRPSDDSS